MSTDSLALLFVGAFISWLVLGILYSFHVAERKPEPPVIRVRIRVQHKPMCLAEDDFYQGCYESLLNALDKEAKDNL